MSKIYVVTRGSYDDSHDVGYFLTEAEAQEYCDWQNQYLDELSFWYHELSLLNLQKEKDQTVVYYDVIVWGWDEIAYIDRRLESRTGDCSHRYSCYSSSIEKLEFEFKLYVETEEEAEKLTSRVLRKIRATYEQSGDFEQAMAAIGGGIGVD